MKLTIYMSVTEFEELSARGIQTLFPFFEISVSNISHEQAQGDSAPSVKFDVNVDLNKVNKKTVVTTEAVPLSMELQPALCPSKFDSCLILMTRSDGVWKRQAEFTSESIVTQCVVEFSKCLAKWGTAHDIRCHGPENLEMYALYMLLTTDQFEKVHKSRWTEAVPDWLVDLKVKKSGFTRERQIIAVQFIMSSVTAFDLIDRRDHAQ